MVLDLNVLTKLLEKCLCAICDACILFHISEHPGERCGKGGTRNEGDTQNRGLVCDFSKESITRDVLSYDGKGPKCIYKSVLHRG